MDFKTRPTVNGTKVALDTNTRGLILSATQKADTAAGTTGIFGPSITATFVDGRYYRVFWYAINVLQTVAGDTFIAAIQDGSTYLAQARSQGALQWPVMMTCFLRGDGTSRTITTSLRRQAGTGTGKVQATTTAVSMLSIEDIGQIATNPWEP